MSEIKWNELRDKAHANAVEHGFWESKPSNEHFLCLVISELMEAVEADRKGRVADRESFEFHLKEEVKECKIPVGSQAYKKCFIYYFKDKIKDTVDDELADAAIRLLDLAGANNLNLNRFCLQHVVTPKKSFTENIYAIVKDMVNYKYSQEEQINYALHQIRRLSEILKIDLSWHIQQKMCYNESREKKHGKKY